jgi:hypothetical protein
VQQSREKRPSKGWVFVKPGTINNVIRQIQKQCFCRRGRCVQRPDVAHNKGEYTMNVSFTELEQRKQHAAVWVVEGETWQHSSRDRRMIARPRPRKRLTLKKYLGERIEVTATVERFGTKKGFYGLEPAIVLTNVNDAEGNQFTGRFWFTKGKSWQGLNLGDRVRFTARVDSCVEAYQGSRSNVGPTPTHIYKYRLIYPTKVTVMEKTA